MDDFRMSYMQVTGPWRSQNLQYAVIKWKKNLEKTLCDG